MLPIPDVVDKAVEPLDIRLIKIAAGLAFAVALFAAPFIFFVQFFLAPEMWQGFSLWHQAANAFGVTIFFGVTVFSSLMFFRSFVPILSQTQWYLRFPVLLLLVTLWGMFGKDVALLFWKPIYHYYGITITPEMEKERQRRESIPRK